MTIISVLFKILHRPSFIFLLSAQEMDDILQMFDENVKGVYGNHTCISLQTSIDEEDENLTSHHHRHLRKTLQVILIQCAKI